VTTHQQPPSSRPFKGVAVRNSIRSQLTLAFIGVSFIPLVLVGLTLAGLTIIAQREQAISRERAVAISLAGQLDDLFQRVENEMAIAVKGLSSQTDFEDTSVISRLPSFPDTIQSVILADANGRERAHIDRLKIVTDATKTDWQYLKEFSIPLQTGQTYYSSLAFDDKTGDPSVYVSVPIFNPRSGEVHGVLISSLRFKRVWDLIAAFPVDRGESVYVLDSINRVVAHVNPSITLSNRRFTLPASVGILADTGLLGNRAVSSSRQVVRGTGSATFTVVAERDLGVALELAFQTVGVIIGLLIVAFLLSSAHGFAAARRLTRPIAALAEAAEIIRKGTDNFDPRTVEPIMLRTDELGQLARVFRNMGTEVKVREQALKQQVQKLRIEIDEAKKEKQVAEITESDMFKDLKAKAVAMRARSSTPRPVIANNQPEEERSSP